MTTNTSENDHWAVHLRNRIKLLKLSSVKQLGTSCLVGGSLEQMQRTPPAAFIACVDGKRICPICFMEMRITSTLKHIQPTLAFAFDLK